MEDRIGKLKTGQQKTFELEHSKKKGWKEQNRAQEICELVNSTIIHGNGVPGEEKKDNGKVPKQIKDINVNIQKA